MTKRSALAGAAWVIGIVTAAFAATPAARAQVVGENVNMVSGRSWPGGDPFLQRQNEPSVALSSVNPLHIVAGANDYRTVDVPDPGAVKATGDAWLGVFKSFDGGQTWQSVLLPGYRQDRSPEGLASPLSGLGAAADPVVRAGPDGLFYLSGIAFDRGSNLGKVFVARFVDLNNKENGDATLARDPIRYVDTRAIDSGTSGQFLDKPWLAVDVPRAGAGSCTLAAAPGRTFQAGNVYLTYATFTGSNESSSKIMFTRSSDCGASWTTPQKLSESNSVNQGTAVAIDPVTGAISVVWRRFATPSQGDAIMYARSTDSGRSFSKAIEIAPRPGGTFLPFDQPMTGTQFRSNTLPSLAVSVDPSGTRSWIHVAWTERTAPGADGRVVLVTSADGAAWSAPAVVDAAPLTDDLGNAFARGHQLMPALTFSQGRLTLLYYDARLDHTRAYYRPRVPFRPVNGSFYEEWRAPLGELLGSPGLVYAPYLDDAGLVQRHTLDVRVAQAPAGPAPRFTSAPVSSYRFGTRGDETPGLTVPGFGGATLEVVAASGDVQLVQQLQVNPPNLKLFQTGLKPFMGDYIDIAGKAFTKSGAGAWIFDTAPTSAPVHYAVWTSNQDVRPPADGDWTHYTPVGGGRTSVFDPAASTPPCVDGQEGMRNQNIYGARITDGLVVSSPQNVKPLSATLTRAFVVSVQNATGAEKAVRFSVSAPPGVLASFRNDGVALDALDVAIPPRSSVQRSVFVRLDTSTNPGASIPVRVDEVVDDPACLGAIPPTCPVVFGGASGFLTLNPPGAVTSLAQPDGATADISTVEIYAPQVNAANIVNANIVNPGLPANAAANIVNANIVNANIVNANIVNANIVNSHIANPDLANANIVNANIVNANIVNTSIATANIVNANIVNAPISDANYTLANTGNTTHSYNVKIVGTAPPTPLQLIVAKNYATPTSIGCQLLDEAHPAVVVSVGDIVPAIVPPEGAIADPNIPDPRITNATIALAPGETAQITLRGALDLASMADVARRLAPVVVPHAGGGWAGALFVASDGTGLPLPLVGVPYSGSLQALGGTPPYTWTLKPGSGPVPDGLALASGGTLAGTPTRTGTWTFTVVVTDSAATPASAERPVILGVSSGPTATSLAPSVGAPVFGQPLTLVATVRAGSAAAPAPTGTVTFRDGDAVIGAATLSGGTAALDASLATGTHALSAWYGGDANYGPSASARVATTVDPGQTSLALTTSVGAAVSGQRVTLAATATAVSPSTGTPMGTITFLDGAVPLGAAALVGGTATLSLASLPVGTHALGASYAGDGSFAASTAAGLTFVVDRATATLALDVAPAAPVFGEAVTLTAAVAIARPGVGTPGGDVTFADGTVVLGTAVLDAGVARLTTTLGAGPHAITASYGGDAAVAATSGAIVVSVGAAPTSTTVAASTGVSVHGQPVVLTATVAPLPPAAGLPAGTVLFLDGDAALGSAPLLGGAATLATSALAVGGHSLSAAYGGSAEFAASASNAIPLVVGRAATSTSLSTSPNPSTAGQAVTLTAAVVVVAPGAGVPGGTVVFSDGATPLGSVALAGGVATLRTSSLAGGSHALAAAYQGDARFSGSTSAATTQVVEYRYAFTGFLTPLVTAGTLAAPSYSGPQTIGSGVPVKWQLRDAATGAYVKALTSAQSLRAVSNPACGGAPPSGATSILLYSPTTGAKGGSTFRYDASGNQFVFNWATSTGTAAGCWEIVLQLDDGSPAKATVVRLQ